MSTKRESLQAQNIKSAKPVHIHLSLVLIAILCYLGWISQRVKTFCVPPRNNHKLGVVLTLCEIDPWGVPYGFIWIFL